MAPPGGIVDRVHERERLTKVVAGVEARQGRLLLLGGEAGVGKSRLVDEAVALATERGFAVGRGACLAEAVTIYLPWHEALTGLGLAHTLDEAAPPDLLGLFVIVQGGRLAARAERPGLGEFADLSAAMLEATESFLRDALTPVSGAAVEGSLLRIALGTKAVIGQRGPGFVVTALLEGRESEAFVNDLRELALTIDRDHGPLLRGWDGSVDAVLPVEPPLRALVDSLKYRGRETAAMSSDPELRKGMLLYNTSLGLQRRAAQQPVLLVLEDLQWADASSLALLHYVARNVRSSRVLLLGTVRREESVARPQLAEALQKLRHEESVEEVDVPRLLPADTRLLAEQLLGAHTLPDAFFDLLARDTEGNPLFVREVLRTLEEAGTVIADPGGRRLTQPVERLTLPSRVRDVIRGRLDRLSEEERAALEAAAVAGTAFRGAVVARLLGEPEVKVLRMMAAIIRRHGLVRPDGERLRFDQQVVRDLLYHELLPDLRKVYHREAAAAMREAGADASEVAEHLYHARDPAAVPILQAAAAAAAKRHGNVEAARLLHQALELAPEPTAAPLWEQYGDALLAAARFADSAAAYGRSGGLDPLARTRCARKRAGALERLGRYGEARRLAEELADAATGEEKGAAFVVQAQCSLRLGDYEGALESGEIALKHLPAAQAPQARSQALHILAECLRYLGMYPRALENLDDARKLHESVGDQRGVAQTLASIGLIHYAQGHHAVALEHQHRSLTIAEAIGDREGIAAALNNIGITHLDRGAYDEALGYLRRSLAIREEIDDQYGTAWSHHNIGLVHQEMGDRAEALASYRRSLGIREQIHDKHGIAALRAALAAVHHLLGEQDVALRAAREAIQVLEELGERRFRSEAYATRARIHLARGDHAAAGTDAAEALRVATDGSLAVQEVEALRVSGLAAGAAGRRSEGEDLFRRSVERATASDLGVEAAQSHLDWGRALAAGGDPSAARDHLVLAEEMFTASGVPRRAAQARAARERAA